MDCIFKGAAAHFPSFPVPRAPFPPTGRWYTKCMARFAFTVTQAKTASFSPLRACRVLGTCEPACIRMLLFHCVFYPVYSFSCVNFSELSLLLHCIFTVKDSRTQFLFLCAIYNSADAFSRSDLQKAHLTRQGNSHSSSGKVGCSQIGAIVKAHPAKARKTVDSRVVLCKKNNQKTDIRVCIVSINIWCRTWNSESVSQLKGVFLYQCMTAHQQTVACRVLISMQRFRLGWASEHNAKC